MNTPSHTTKRSAGGRVLLYGINYAPEPIGIGKYSSELAEYLFDHGFSVDVVTAVPHYPGWKIPKGYRNRYSSERIKGVRVFRCPLFIKRNMRGCARIAAPITFALSSAPVAVWRIFRDRPDIVLCVEPTLFSAPLALIAAKLVGAKTFLHVQDLEVDAAFVMKHISGDRLKRLAHWFERAVLKGFDHVLTISNQMADRLRCKGIAAEKISVIRNWVNVEEIRSLDTPSPYRAECSIAEANFVVLYSGNIGLKQGLDVVPEIAERLRAQSDIVFVISGDGPEKGKLVQRCAAMSNVRFLPLQPTERLCDLLNLADVHLLPQVAGIADLVLPSKIGGMLASGKPSIVQTVPGTELYDFLDGAAVLVPPGDVGACADAILLVRQNQDVVGKKAVGRCLAALDYRSNLAAFCDLFLNELK